MTQCEINCTASSFLVIAKTALGLFFFQKVGPDVEDSVSRATYRNLLTILPDGPLVIEHAYQAVENKVAKVEKYVEVWLRYQSLWDMETNLVYNKLENSLEKWIILLRNIRYFYYVFRGTYASLLHDWK